jgi:hypothetical protein
LLVERHEHEHYPIPAANPVAVLRFLIDRQGLTQRDLIPQFGSESAVSMFLAGQRQLTLEQLRRLRGQVPITGGSLPGQGGKEALDSEVDCAAEEGSCEEGSAISLCRYRLLGRGGGFLAGIRSRSQALCTILGAMTGPTLVRPPPNRAPFLPIDHD